MENEAPSADATPWRRWPWVMVAALLLGVVLAVIWVRAEARRIQDQRQTEMPSSAQPMR